MQRRWTLALALTGACASTPAPVAAPVATATPVVTEAPVVDAGAPVAAPAPVFSVATPLGENGGVIMAEQPGGTVTLHPESGPDLTLADGERVTFVDNNATVGGGDASAMVEARGVRGAVPNARVITETRLERAATGGAAVFSAIFSCGDLCHREVWLIGATGQRARVTDQAGADITVAWRPDGAQVAVGSFGLWVVRAADAHVEAMEAFTSPAYAPDGALFARGVREDDGVFALADGTPPRRVFGAPGRVPTATESAPEEDPSPVVFEQDGAVLRATFLRAPRRRVTARAGRDGRPAAAPDADAIAATVFVREQMTACNAERARLHEDPVFPEATTVGALRRTAPRVYVARITRPSAEPVEVSVDLRTHHIQSPRGPRVALGGGLDFCPPAVWLGPQND